jgi:sec-independent protein translocase protein TatB
MFDIGWSEMFVIVVVALVVIGPKDLPRLIREVGRWTAKARGMAREFQRSFDDMVREAELDDIRKTVEQARPSNLTKTIRDAIDPEGELDDAFALEEQEKATAKPESAAPAPAPSPAKEGPGAIPAPAPAATPANGAAVEPPPSTATAASNGGGATDTGVVAARPDGEREVAAAPNGENKP